MNEKHAIKRLMCHQVVDLSGSLGRDKRHSVKCQRIVNGMNFKYQSARRFVIRNVSMLDILATRYNPIYIKMYAKQKAVSELENERVCLMSCTEYLMAD